ncbi:phage holin family protein [Algoriella sp.]|uniref:phage holin family protein n=1 Tax=Algoriella sp. TaxID=1872434 RepID=UPI002FCABD67
MNQIFIYPDWILFIALTFLMAIDFMTGFMKAKFLKVNRSSEAFRKTVKKIIQYCSAIIVVIVILNLMRFDQSNQFFKDYSNWLQNGVIVLMVYIELTSILENAIAIDKTSTFSKVFIIPFHRLLTLQLKSNPMYSFSQEEQRKVEVNKLKRQKEIL